MYPFRLRALYIMIMWKRAHCAPEIRNRIIIASTIMRLLIYTQNWSDRKRNLFISLTNTSILSSQFNSLPDSSIAIIGATPTDNQVDVCHCHGTNEVIMCTQDLWHLLP